jgi:4-amino-4-deoxy-L-arabinose transferase-like glycosyltransferase
MPNITIKRLDARLLWTLFGLAALSFAFTLTLPYVGEEGVYTITALEMKLRGNLLLNTLYGGNYGRPPLLNWLIIGLSDVLGWQHVLQASRLVAALSTVATGLVLAWLAHALTRDARFAAFTALVYLTSDALFYRGWLAYSDPLFALLVFSAIACLWVAAERRDARLLWLAALALVCASLAKAPTAYIFYAGAGCVLLCRRDTRAFLLRPAALLPHLLAIGAFFVWHDLLTAGTQKATEASVVLEKLSKFELGPYLYQLWWFPLESLLRFLPASALAIYFWWRKSATAPAPAPKLSIATCAWILGLNYLPYWLGPNTGIRYVLPLYPLAALVIAYLLWPQSEARKRTVLCWLIAAIAFKYLLALWAFPAYQQKFRGDYAGVAAQIEALTKGSPLYTTDVSATGLSVTANIDTMRFPAQPLQWPPPEWSSGFVLSYTENPELGRLWRKFQLGGNEIFLLCRGAACAAESRDAQPAPTR